MSPDLLQNILLFVVIGVAFYFLAIRPQQKRAKAQQSLTNSLEPGARVMISSGILGTVKHVGDRQAILEISPGIEMTVVKGAVARVLKPEDDEFEYADDEAVAEGDVEPADVVADAAPATDETPAAPQN